MEEGPFSKRCFMSVRKAALFVVVLVLTLTPVVPSSNPPSGQSPLLDVYKAGPIRLEPDPAFGKNTKWNLLFFNRSCDLTLAPDGSIFIAAGTENKVFKFDPQGNLVKSFGQKGQGPGDFNGPGDLSVLDGKYLVVGEYALSRRISLFDLDGKFSRLLTTKRTTYRPLALRDGKVAYLSFRSTGDGGTGTKRIQSVVIRAIDSPNETVVAEYTFNSGAVMIGQNFSFNFGNDSGDAFIAATKEGNLLVGNSLQTYLEVFSPEGVKLSRVDLGLDPIPVTKDYIKRFKDVVIGELRQDSRYAQGPMKDMVKQLENASIDHVFADHIPLYRKVSVDAEGNILVFKKTECLAGCPILMRVYSPEGKFICETELQEGAFDLDVDPRGKSAAFGPDGLIAMVEVKDAEEFELRVIRVNYKPSPAK
jgi:hypothetical protein